MKISADNQINGLIQIYKKIKPEIENRISKFKSVWEKGTEQDLFAELAFCILTPQSKARSGWQAICTLREKNLLYCGVYEEINRELNIVRFKNKKSEYLINAREKFLNNRDISLKQALSFQKNIQSKRDWLVKEIKGYGLKEASHFLRNIGFGKDIAILDRHVLKNLKLFGVISEIPTSLMKSRYINIENKLRSFSKEIKIPMGHLDFVFWYKEAGEVFK